MHRLAVAGVVHCVHFNCGHGLCCHPPRLLLVRNRRRGRNVQSHMHDDLLVDGQPLCLYQHPTRALL